MRRRLTPPRPLLARRQPREQAREPGIRLYLAVATCVSCRPHVSTIQNCHSSSSRSRACESGPRMCRSPLRHRSRTSRTARVQVIDQYARESPPAQTIEYRIRSHIFGTSAVGAVNRRVRLTPRIWELDLMVGMRMATNVTRTKARPASDVAGRVPSSEAPIVKEQSCTRSRKSSGSGPSASSRRAAVPQVLATPPTCITARSSR